MARPATGSWFIRFLKSRERCDGFTVPRIFNTTPIFLVLFGNQNIICLPMNTLTSIRCFLIAVFSSLFLFNALADQSTDAIIQSAMRYVFQNAGVDDPSVTILEVGGGFARVKIRSISGKTDPAIAFLKGGPDGKWKVLTLGTGFSPEDLSELGIPDYIRN